MPTIPTRRSFFATVHNGQTFILTNKQCLSKFLLKLLYLDNVDKNHLLRGSIQFDVTPYGKHADIARKMKDVTISEFRCKEGCVNPIKEWTAFELIATRQCLARYRSIRTLLGISNQRPSCVREPGVFYRLRWVYGGKEYFRYGHKGKYSTMNGATIAAKRVLKLWPPKGDKKIEMFIEKFFIRPAEEFKVES